MITKILTGVLLAISITMFGYLYNSIDTVIKDKEALKAKEASVTTQLKLIRDAELAYLGVNGRYTASWDTLRNFINNGRVPIVDRHEEIIQKAYGGEEVKVTIDTLGYTSAKDVIFKRNFTVNAGDDGTFKSYLVKVGDHVLTAQRAFIIVDGLGKERAQPFVEGGQVTALEPVKAGDKVSKGQLLVSYSSNAYDTNTDISKVGFKPGSDIMFDIFVGKVDKGGVPVQVIEVKDPSPDDATRKETNDQKPRKPLRFGSRLDVSTAGNWE
ncbi:MAG TPA: hypothetical protein VK508_08685 [Cyclobacteriaceae bacterium]|nr:hypothetical protein [Cyclobacteriaceae bacterium]